MSRKSRHLKMGHPARAQRRMLAQTRFQQPDATEKNIQNLNRMMRAEIARAPEEFGAVTGPLAVAAKHVAPHLVEVHGFEPADEHTAAIEHWLLGTWGEHIHQFDAEGYMRWRNDCRERVA